MAWLRRVSDLPEPSFDVAACVERVRQRDEDAARALFRHLYPLVARLVRSHLPRRTSQEDLVQTVFMKVFANLDRFSGAVPLEHWVSRIAINTCLNQLAAEKARPELRWADLSEEQTEALEAVTAGPEELDPLAEPGGAGDRREAAGAACPAGAVAADAAAPGRPFGGGGPADHRLECAGDQGARLPGAPEAAEALREADGGVEDDL